MENCARHTCNKVLVQSDKCIMPLYLKGSVGTVEELRGVGGKQLVLDFSFLSKFCCPKCVAEEIELGLWTKLPKHGFQEPLDEQIGTESCANCDRALANEDKCLMLLKITGFIGNVRELNRAGGKEFTLDFPLQANPNIKTPAKFCCSKCASRIIRLGFRVVYVTCQV